MKKKLQESYEKFKGPCGDGDKGTFHSYIDIYDEIFSKFYKDEFNFLEIGILNGKSIHLWNDYFEKANIFAVDINNKDHLNLENSRTFIFHDDATKADFLKKVINKKFKIIIDDGSHQLNDQISSFSLLKDLIEDGGLYIIEDVFPAHVQPIQNEFENCFNVLNLTHERPFCPDNILMIYEKK
jgi:hypothetical protein